MLLLETCYKYTCVMLSWSLFLIYFATKMKDSQYSAFILENKSKFLCYTVYKAKKIRDSMLQRGGKLSQFLFGCGRTMTADVCCLHAINFIFPCFSTFVYLSRNFLLNGLAFQHLKFVRSVGLYFIYAAMSF